MYKLNLVFDHLVIISCSNNPTHKYFLAVDPVTGALFISDTNSRRIYRVHSLTGGRLLADNAEVVAGTGEQCLPFDERCGDGGKAVEATLMSPKGKANRKEEKVGTFNDAADRGDHQVVLVLLPLTCNICKRVLLQ